MTSDPLHPAVRAVLGEYVNPTGKYDEITDLLTEMDTVLQTGRDHVGTAVPDGQRIVSACVQICSLLIRKNSAYGGSALDPVEVFSDANANVRLAVRMDDKLARIKRGHELAQEDAIVDLAGYLLLYIAANLPPQARQAST